MKKNNKYKTITLPGTNGQLDYREQFEMQVFASVLGSATVFKERDCYRVKATKKQAKEIQELIDTHTADLDKIMEGLLIAFIRRVKLFANPETRLSVINLNQ